jgi:hypothetical protein
LSKNAGSVLNQSGSTTLGWGVHAAHLERGEEGLHVGGGHHLGHEGGILRHLLHEALHAGRGEEAAAATTTTAAAATCNAKPPTLCCSRKF